MNNYGKRKGVLLLSDGIDSPVAGYLMMKKGVEIIALHMDNGPQARNALEKVKKLVSQLEKLGSRKIDLIVAPHYQNHIEFVKKCDLNLHCVLCKRMMLMTAQMVAEKEGADFIITGGSLGQVASQTLLNLQVEEEAVKIPVVRPLIGMDKVEIIEIARKIGTYDISILPGQCCGMAPEHPATRAWLNEVKREEKKLPFDKMLKQVKDGLKTTV